ncbi:Tungsten-containing aldehyde:ferredoxin oxidoreductase [Acidilobus saccharovorans 345-15]|uniref:Tungsten-containing aldehyde:ferredoxin oxidoreductase n=1 Tax=Acidilobus saccharovorans (strain DSM 16705 / JCM 18335 / VKM B-2471 / 345-15) TaxID=666510 RepID=D9Q312_ACIS3|nr:aldehyde ferredoxin oxidoreductase family protein [Acidilobus saccharovorans]ADL19700.1 Tungsten-containing aldehyde:ferredoxin oxidoreductase [Acidilobus saccharovorans 345-15]
MTRLKGYGGKVLRVDLTHRTYRAEELDPSLAKAFIGGRGLNAYRLYWEVPPGVDPLGPENKLMIATGPLVGFPHGLGSRLNVTSRSPLTGLLGDSNAGTHFSEEMKFAGYDQIIIEGRSERPVYLYITESGVEFMDAEGLWGFTVSQTHEAIRHELGDQRVQVGAVGPAAENLVKFAGVFFNVYRAAGRTGMGTVLASKNVKAIAVRGDGYIEAENVDELIKVIDEMLRRIYENPQYWPRRIMGTSRVLMAGQRLGFLPGRHFQDPVVDYAYDVSGERLAREYNVKVRACSAGCALPCARFFMIKRGPLAGLMGEGPEYEPLGGFTVRVGNRDLDRALKIILKVADYGMDAITTSEVIAWLMELRQRGEITDEEAGVKLEWGNPDTIEELVDMIAYRRGIGKVLAEGVKRASEMLNRGKDIAFHVKGLEMIQADPRALKGYGLGFAVASRGADHLRSEPFVEVEDDPELGKKMFGEPEAAMRLGVKGKGKLINYFEDLNAIVDSFESCKNTAENMLILDFDMAARAYTAITGIHVTESEMREAGMRIVNIERAYLVREGVRRSHDRLPKRFLEEPLRSGPAKGHVIELDVMLDEYYDVRGWTRDGVPRRSTLLRLGLKEVAMDLEARGIKLED